MEGGNVLYRGSHHPEVLNSWMDLEDLEERLQRGFEARAVCAPRGPEDLPAMQPRSLQYALIRACADGVMD